MQAQPPVKLLDLNVWLTASWARHRHHEVAREWLDQQDDEPAFCRATQMAPVRLITNPAIAGRDALSRREAWDALDYLMADSRVRLLPEPETLEPLSDDYLAAFAQAANAEHGDVFRPRTVEATWKTRS